MKHFTVPVEYVHSLTEITQNKIEALGVRTLLIDLDNTLVYWHTRHFTPGAEAWIREMMASGVECILFTNARPARTQELAEKLGVACVSLAGKPWPIAFWRAGKVAAHKKDSWLAVGDQIFTDVLGANLFGIPAIYVSPASDAEWGWTRLVRRIERRLLARRGR